MSPELSPAEQIRYHRHLILPEIGAAGQTKLKQARVLMIGAGGLGSPTGLYLAAAGVGTIGIVDFDRVDASNLQRQILHGTKDVGRAKVASAQDRLQDINPHVRVEPHETRLTRDNALDLIREYNVVVDGTDNFSTRYLVNDACVLLGKPNVYGAIFRFEGQASVFWADRGACYRCLYPEPPPPGLVPSCADAGVLGVLPGIIGAIQATETIKVITGCGVRLVNRLLLFDALTMKFREFSLQKDPECPVCGTHPTITELADYEAFCGCAPATAAAATDVKEITVTELKRRLDAGEPVELIDVREPYEFAYSRIEAARLIPMTEVLQRHDQLDPARETIFMCRSGQRSADIIRYLAQAGYAGPMANLKGGILAWSDEVDPSVPKY